MYTDQTGCFSTTSYCGMQYVMVLYEPTKSNAMLVEPMQNRTSGEMLATYLTLENRLKKTGIEPKLHTLDNECSNEFKEAIRKNVGNYQLVPPHDHRRNVAEKTIQVFRDHFIYLYCAVLTHHSQFACGAGSYVNQNTISICCVPQGWTITNLLLKSLVGRSTTTIQTHLHPWAKLSKCT